jgi:hypothetical protein
MPRAEFQAYAWDFIQRPEGPSKLARKIAEAIWTLGERVLVDGLRQRTTLDKLTAELTRTGRPHAMLYVETPPDLSFKLYRDREGSRVNALEFYALRNSPVEQGVASLISQADAIVYNWIGETYRSAIRQIMGECGVRSL